MKWPGVTGLGRSDRELVVLSTGQRCMGNALQGCCTCVMRMLPNSLRSKIGPDLEKRDEAFVDF